MRKSASFIVFTCISFPLLVFADSNSFQNYINYANSIRGDIGQKGSTFNPGQTFKKYNPNPSQGNYYSGVTQSGDNNLDNDAVSGTSKDKAGSTIVNAFKTRPVFKINRNSEAMKRSDIIKDDSYNISHGISDKYVDCKKHTSCKTTYIKKVCDEGTRYLEKNCTKTANVTIKLVTETINDNATYKSPFKRLVTVPEEGIITGFSVATQIGGFHWSRHFSATFNAIALTYVSGDSSAPIFKNTNLSIRVHKGDQLVFRVLGYWALLHKGITSANYSMTMQVKRPQIDWQEVCADVN